MPQQQRSSSTNNANNPDGLEENNKCSSTNHLKSEIDKPSSDRSIKPPMSTSEKQKELSNDNGAPAVSNSVKATNVISSSVPKLPSISVVSTSAVHGSGNVDKDAFVNVQKNEIEREMKGNDEVSRKNLELLELNIKSVEDQNNTQNGKRTHHHRTNGVNRYNHLPWSHYHEDQDAIFVVDA